MNIDLAEQILFSTFVDVPFHSLYFYFNKKPLTLKYGGTCSDKVLHAFDVFKENSFDVHLHSSFINDVECHRLLRLEINGSSYFADVGNGWPAVKLFPAEREISYFNNGILFFTKLTRERVEIFQKRDGEIIKSVSIPINSKSEEEIKNDIRARFSKTFPFTGRIRFAQIVGDRFLFLRDTNLYTYTSNGTEIESGITSEKLAECLKNKFDFPIDSFLAEEKINE